jgi:hypothetical protein
MNYFELSLYNAMTIPVVIELSSFFILFIETEKGLNNPNSAKYIKQKTIKEIMEY